MDDTHGKGAADGHPSEMSKLPGTDTQDTTQNATEPQGIIGDAASEPLDFEASGSKVSAEISTDDDGKPKIETGARVELEFSNIDLSGPAHSRNNATGETSAAAAARVTKYGSTIRKRVLSVLTLSGRPMTAEMIVGQLILDGVIGESRFARSVPSYRPRCSELAERGLIRDSGDRGKGMCGSGAVAWEIVPISERSAVLTGHAPQGKANLKSVARKQAKRLLANSGMTPTDLVATELEAYLDQSGDLVELLAFLLAARAVKNKAEVACG